ncbi:MAG TPA: hypothetical protein PK765_04450 [bacterium]|nr:hypothetical protein [bacterium]
MSTLPAVEYWLLVPDWFVYFSLLVPVVCCIVTISFTLSLRRISRDIMEATQHEIPAGAGNARYRD